MKGIIGKLIGLR